MKLTQISSLEKVRTAADIRNEVSYVRLLRGERFCYQVVAEGTREWITDVTAMGLNARIYAVACAAMDYPANPDNCDEDYLTKTPGTMPDILIPMGDVKPQDGPAPEVQTFWVELRVPEDCPPGRTAVAVTAAGESVVLNAEVLPAALPPRELLFTQWFHVDSIAIAHGVAVYSEAHWGLIDRYMALAAELGMNMILTPVITPPLDTEQGRERLNVQLVDIAVQGDPGQESYQFDFSRLGRWLGLCRKNGIQYFEISHLFSQWGANFTPNIYGKVGQSQKHLFGWHVPSRDPGYARFLACFLPALVAYLEGEGVAENCYFHISDEPSGSQLENYRYAYGVVKPLLGRCKLMDALSDYEFYREGLVENPVCANDAMVPFLENGAENLWTYYCCAQGRAVGNRFLAMPAYRNRILGLQMYKFRVKGFLHWGYNFYLSQLSRYPIDPYATTSADRAFPSGDPFSVYPGEGKPLPSMRAMVFREALQDVQICRALEAKIGRAAVIALIDREAGMELTFTEYPRRSDFVPKLMERMKEMLR